jgi:hypothetical protein
VRPRESVKKVKDTSGKEMSKRILSRKEKTTKKKKQNTTTTDVLDRLAHSIKEIPVHVIAHHMINSKATSNPMIFHVEYPCNGGLQFAWYPPHDSSLTCRILNSLYATLVNPAHAAGERKEHRIIVDALIIGLLSFTKKTSQSQELARKQLAYYFGTTALGSIKQVSITEQKSDESSSDADDDDESGDSNSSSRDETYDISRFIDLYLLPTQMACFMWHGARCPK